MSQSKTSPIDLDQINELAKRFADRQMFAEAAELFQIALRCDPSNLGIKLSLAQVRNQKRRDTEGQSEADALREALRRDAIDSFHFFGLAALYAERGKPRQAMMCLDLARKKEEVNPFIYKLLGRLLLQGQHFDAAATALRTARRYNPFDREAAELLSRAEYERRNYRQALEAVIDAFLLVRETDHEHNERLQRRIRTLKRVADTSSQEVVTLFHARREKLQTDFDRLELQRERLLRRETSTGDDTAALLAAPRRHEGRIELAARLRALDVWANLSDEQIFQLTQVTYEERCAKDDVIFKYKSDGMDIFVLEEGDVVIRRPTDYGTYELGTIKAGAVFGEANFIARSKRSGDAIAGGRCRLLRLDAEELDKLINDHPELGVQVYSSFWHGLAQKLRNTNEQLRSFFSEETVPENFLKLRHASQPDTVEVGSSDKIRLFREQGLTGAELTTLANFSNVKRFPAGSHLFHEGDKGHEMYVVLKGKVMISKYIPGGGEEALAILERGDFFGEMSLVDGQPRSADAKTFEGPVTVVAFDDKTLLEVMSMDPLAALEFMVLLCRLVCKRLGEIDEKVTSWRIMTGHRSGTDAETIQWQAS